MSDATGLGGVGGGKSGAGPTQKNAYMRSPRPLPHGSVQWTSRYGPGATSGTTNSTLATHWLVGRPAHSPCRSSTRRSRRIAHPRRSRRTGSCRRSGRSTRRTARHGVCRARVVHPCHRCCRHDEVTGQVELPIERPLRTTGGRGGSEHADERDREHRRRAPSQPSQPSSLTTHRRAEAPRGCPPTTRPGIPACSRWVPCRASDGSGHHRARPAQAVRAARCGEGHRPRRAAGRDLRPPRHERRRQDHHRGDPRGLPLPLRGRGVGVGRRPCEAHPCVAGTHRARAPGERARPRVHGARDRRHVRPVLRSLARRRRHHHARRAAREQREARGNAVGRSEAPGRRCARPDRRPRPAVPRRADHRFRPAGATRTRGT